MRCRPALFFCNRGGTGPPAGFRQIQPPRKGAFPCAPRLRRAQAACGFPRKGGGPACDAGRPFFAIGVEPTLRPAFAKPRPRGRELFPAPRGFAGPKRPVAFPARAGGPACDAGRPLFLQLRWGRRGDTLSDKHPPNPAAMEGGPTCAPSASSRWIWTAPCCAATRPSPPMPAPCWNGCAARESAWSTPRPGRPAGWPACACRPRTGWSATTACWSTGTAAWSPGKACPPASSGRCCGRFWPPSPAPAWPLSWRRALRQLQRPRALARRRLPALHPAGPTAPGGG